jgi:F0F1-type ATP synthase membrane subunit b/b'
MATDTDQTASAGQDTSAATGNDEIAKLKEINQRLQGKLTDVEKKYNQFASMYKDVDPDEYKNLKSTLEQKDRELAEKDPAKMEEVWERKFNRFKTDAETEKAKLLKDLDTYKAENKTLKVTDKVMAEISGLFNPDAVKFIKREVEEFCDLDDDGSIVVKDENGDIVFRNGKLVTIKDFGESLADKYPSLAKSTGSSGTRDATPGEKRPSRPGGRIPETYAELAAMPNSREVFERLKRENPAALNKILATMKA